MAATTLGFIPLQLIPTSCIGQYTFDKGFPTNGTYVVVKTPTVAQQLQLTKSFKEMQTGSKEINNNDSANKPVLLRCKRRVDFTGLGCKLVDSHSPSVSRRNERERKRVKMVNMGFETLRQHVPTGRKNKKMSKVETLRSAVQYIKQLQELLDSHETAVNDLLSDVDMDVLENKVAEIIQNSENDDNNNNNNNLNTEHSMIINTDLMLNDFDDTNVNSDIMNINSGLVNSFQTTHDHRTPEPSPSVPQSPHNFQEQHFFATYQNGNIVFSSQYENVSSCTSAMYSQASPSGSLHSPTSSIVSDSSYDSVGQDEEDILSFSNWF